MKHCRVASHHPNGFEIHIFFVVLVIAMGAEIELEQVLNTIRRAALEPELWTKVQSETAAYLGAPVSQIAVAEHTGDRNFISHTLNLPELDQALPEWAPQSEIVTHAASNRNWRYIVDYDYIDEAGMARSPFYAFNDEYDIRYRLVLRLLDTPDRSEVMLWAWPQKLGHPQSEHLERLSHIQEALRTSAYVCDARYHSDSENTEIEQILEGFLCPAMVVDGQGQLIGANSIAKRHLGINWGLTLENNVLVPLMLESRTPFKCLIADCSKQAAHGRPSEMASSLMLEMPQLSDKMIVRALPLATRQHFLHSARHQVLLLATSTSPLEFSIESVAHVYGLTLAETEVLSLFLSASSIPEISSLRGVSNETVRRQMKAIMSKVGVSRQAELVLAITSISNGFSIAP